MEDDSLFLLLFSEQQARNPKKIYHIINGKRTVSVLYQALKMNLMSEFKTYPSLSATAFDTAIDRLLKANNLILKGDCLLLSHEGQQLLNSKTVKYSFLKIQSDAFYFEPIRSVFKLRFFLAIQVISQWSYQEQDYFPTTENLRVQFFVKDWFKKIYRVPNLSSKFQKELFLLLAVLEDEQAQLLTALMTGYLQEGQTETQEARRLSLSMNWVQRAEDNAFNRILAQLKESGETLYPLLSGLVSDVVWQELPLSESAATTWQDYKQGMSLEIIAQKRHLKESTIKEHLLECAILLPEFDFKYIFEQMGLYKVPKIDVNQHYSEFQSTFPETEFLGFRLIQIQKLKELA